MTTPTVPGRTTARLHEKRCPSCDARMVYGEPKGRDYWPQRLSLTQEQVSLLLIAAAEFGELHADFSEKALERGEEPPEPPSWVEFVDWLSVDALRDFGSAHPEYDGKRRINGQYGNAQPDPIPYAPLPPKIRGAA